MQELPIPPKFSSFDTLLFCPSSCLCICCFYLKPLPVSERRRTFDENTLIIQSGEVNQEFTLKSSARLCGWGRMTPRSSHFSSFSHTLKRVLMSFTRVLKVSIARKSTDSLILFPWWRWCWWALPDSTSEVSHLSWGGKKKLQTLGAFTAPRMN